MKKEVRKKAIIIGVVISALILCAVPILINTSNKNTTKLAKLEEPETKQYSTEATVGSESELREFTYTKDDTAKTVTLTKYNNTTATSLTIHSKYNISDVEYKTIISSTINDSASVGTSNYFLRNCNITDIVFEDDIEINKAKGLFANYNKIKNVYIGKVKITGESVGALFDGCSSLESIEGLSNFDTSKVTDMSYMFRGCGRLTSIDVSGLNTSNVTNMQYMFSGCSALTSIDVSSFNTSNVINMNGMFDGCSSLEGIEGLSNFDTSSVGQMAFMFRDCSSLTNLEIDGWNLLNLSSGYRTEIFTGDVSLKNTNLRNWKVNETTVKSLFKETNIGGKLKLDNWNIVGGTISLSGMFQGCTNLTAIDLSNFDTSNVTDMNYMFLECSSLESIDLSNWDTSKVTGMSRMFDGCSSLESIEGLSTFDTSKVTDMEVMFRGCSRLISIDVSGFDTSNVTSMYGMFHGCSKLISIDVSGFDTSNVKYMSRMFYECSSLASIDLSNWNTTGLASASTSNNLINSMFYNCTSLTSVNLSNWHISNNMLSSMTSSSNSDPAMFNGCNSLTSLNLSNWDVSKVTSMFTVFTNYFNSLVDIDVSNWNTSNVTNMASMFYGCSSLESIKGLETWDTSNVTNMSAMFQGCSSLTTITGISEWNTVKVNYMNYMFNGCSSLTNLDIKKWYTVNVTSMTSMFDGCYRLEGLDISNWITSKVTNIDKMFYGCYALKSIDMRRVEIEKTIGNTMVNTKDMFTGCDFDMIVTPRTVKQTVALPYTMYEEDGTEYTQLPETSKTLYREIQNIQYTVTFVNDEGVTLDTQTVARGNSATAPELTKPGYKLTWDKDFSNVTSDLTVNAVWTPESYVIVYSANGGTINDASYATTYTYGVGATLPTNVTKQGYNFAGWYDNAGLTGTAVTTIGVTETGTKVYYAKWTPKSGTTEDTGTRYVVEYYKENVNGEYEKDESATLTLYGETDSLVTAQEKEYEGYELNSAHPESKIASNILPDGSLVLKAYYKRNTYKITYVINGGRINDTNYVKNYTYGVGGALPTNVTKQGYNFAGWYENSDLSGTQVTEIGTNETGEKVYYAKWTPKSGTTEETGTRYIVEYYKENVNGEYEKVESETLTKYGETDSIAVAPQTTFTGFALDLNNENNKLYGIITPDGSLVLKVYYRRNAYTVTLNTNGGTIVTGEITKYKYGIETNLPQNVEKPGYTFDGWYDNAEFTGTAVTKIGVADIGNKTYYAKWIAESGENGPTYTIKYYKQNTVKNGYEEVLEDTKTLHGQTDTLVTIPEKAYTGFKENVAHEGRNVAGIITSDGSLSLSRYYDREEYNIVYVLNDGIINDTNYVTTYTYGIGANLPQNVTKQGYVFDGWYENAELTGTAVEQISNTDAEIKIYYASWLKDTDGDGIPDIEDDNTQVAYKVEHYKQNLSQDGYEAPETENLQGNLGSTVTAVSKEYTGFSVTETDETIASGEVLVDGSLTLKLYYNRNSYKVTLNTNDGTIVGQNLENYTYGVGATLPTNVTKQGFAFDGWYEDEACEGIQVTSIGITETGEKTYYAKMLTDANGNGIPDEKEQGTQVAYTVEHYRQNLSQNGYDEPERETKQGGLGTTVNAVAKTYKGFALTTTENTLPSGEVKADGSLILKLYYNRNTYTVVLNTDGGEIESGKEVTSYTYGIGAALPTNVTKQGYVFRGWFEQRYFLGTAVTEIGTEDTGDKTYYAKMLKDTDGDGTPDIEDPDTKVNYTVLHYRQNLNQNGYDEPERETKQADLGSAVTATPKEYPGFTVTITNDTVLNGTVTENNALILKLYYNRNTYKLPLNIDGKIEEIEYVYGEEITLPTDKEKEGCTFEGWYDNKDLTGAPVEKVDTSELDPENPPTYYIKWTANEGIAYTVKHYKQEGNTNTYTLADTEELTGTAGETVTAKPKTYEGYVENTTVSERIPSGIVKEDGTLELVLIYDTIKLTVTFKDGDTTVDTQTIVYGENAVAPTPTKPGYILRWDKEFNNVKTNLTVNAVWLKDTDGDGIPDIEDSDTKVSYTIEHYKQNLNQNGYDEPERETKQANLGSAVTATPKEYQGFTVTITNDTVLNGIVTENNALTLKLYYNRRNYAVTLMPNEGRIVEGNVISYTYGIGATLPQNVTKQGYVFRGWYDNENLSGTAVTTIGVTETGAKVYYASWLKDTDGDGIPDIEDNDTQVRYTVEHYKQNVSQDGYEAPETENLQGNLGSIVTAEPKEYPGFIQETTENTVESGEVVVDGSLTLKLYYNRQNYGIVYETNGGTIEDKNYVTSYTYGIVVSLPMNVTKIGYRFGGWYENEDLTGNAVAQTKIGDIGAKTYYANWIVEGNTAYKVEHYKQTENGYILSDTDNLTARTGVTVTAVPKTYEGYEENINHEERISEGTVAGNGNLVLKLYYDMLTYEVTFKDGETVLSTQTINYGENAVAPSLAKEGYILRWDKEFNNVKTDLNINAIWLKDTDGDGIPDIEDDETLVEYIVRHYKQIGDKAEYELADTDTLQGQLGTVVTASPKTYVGYVENDKIIARIPSGELTGEGNLQLRLFYDTIKYEVTFKNGNDIVNTTKVPHGGTVEPPVIIKEGYVLSWDKSLNNITENKTINAVWTKVGEAEQTYKVEHYVQTKEGKYTLKETDTLVGSIGEAVTASPKTYEEYVLDETNENTVKTGEIKEGSGLVLKLYYNYKRYEVIFKDGEEEVGRVEVIHGEKAEPPEITKEGYILSWDKNINNITGEQTITAVWTKDPNYKDPNAKPEDNTNNKPDNNKPTIDKLPNDGKEERPSILPKTGEEVVTIVTVIGLLGVAVIYFVKYKVK